MTTPYGCSLPYLVMVSYHDHPLESVVAILRVLQHQGDECLHLQDLSSLLHQHIVILHGTCMSHACHMPVMCHTHLEGQVNHVPPLERSMGASHGHYLGFPDHPVVDTVTPTS